MLPITLSPLESPNSKIAWISSSSNLLSGDFKSSSYSKLLSMIVLSDWQYFDVKTKKNNILTFERSPSESESISLNFLFTSSIDWNFCWISKNVNCDIHVDLLQHDIYQIFITIFMTIKSTFFLDQLKTMADFYWKCLTANFQES